MQAFSSTRLLLSMVIVAFSATPICFAQAEPQGKALLDAYELSGLGIVGRELAGETSCGPNSKGKNEAELLDAVGGRAVAKIQWKAGEGGSCEVFVSKGESSERLGRGWDFPETESESLGLVYYESLAGFARVLEHRQPPGLWVRVEDVPEGRLHPWIAILTRYARAFKGYEGQQLHEGPSGDSPVLVTLRDKKLRNSEVHRLVPTKSLSGSWAQFEVIEFDGDFDFYDPEHSKATGRQWKGWLRLVNESGEPTFWYYTRD